MVPFLERILLTNFRKLLPEYLFENPSKKRSRKSRIDSDRFRKVFRREILAGLGLAVNPSDYRHIAIRISRRFLSKTLQFQPEETPDESNHENEYEYEDEVLDLQAGHSSRTAGIVYARGLFKTTGEIQSLKYRFREASIISLSYFYYFIVSSIIYIA